MYEIGIAVASFGGVVAFIGAMIEATQLKEKGVKPRPTDWRALIIPPLHVIIMCREFQHCKQGAITFLVGILLMALGFLALFMG